MIGNPIFTGETDTLGRKVFEFPITEAADKDDLPTMTDPGDFEVCAATSMAYTADFTIGFSLGADNVWTQFAGGEEEV